MKTAIKKLLKSIAINLPMGAREAVFEALWDKLGHNDKSKTIAMLVQRQGITGFITQGDQGTIQSSSGDAEVFAVYSRTGSWAKRTNDILTKFFAPTGSGTYIDIGANIGLTTISVAQWSNVNCIAFEPEPINFYHLQANIARNCHHRNVRLENSAVFNCTATLQFEVATFNLGDHRVKISYAPGQQGEESRKAIEVPAVALDKIVSEPKLPLAVKIDTQGSEPFVFAGGKQTLALADLIILEWSPYQIRRLKGDPKIVTDFLLENFQYLVVADRESGKPDHPLPIAEGCAFMLNYIEKNQNDPSAYIDIIANRC